MAGGRRAKLTPQLQGRIVQAVVAGSSQNERLRTSDGADETP
jgi:hypothetical protein